MESLIRCAGCGRKPRIKPNAQRRGWGHEVASPQGTSKTVLSPPQRGKTAQAYWAYKNAAQHQGEFTWGQQPGLRESARIDRQTIHRDSPTLSILPATTFSLCFPLPDATPPHRSIFDKLTDPSLYTGSHKHRFDEDGRGRGLEGRDSVAKGLGTGGVTAYYGEGTVVSIAQLLRNEKLDPGHMNKVRQFPDGSSILSPHNRSWRHADTKWRPETPRGIYPHNNPSYLRTPGASPSQTPNSARRLMPPSLTSSPSSQLLPAHDIAQLSQPQSSFAASQSYHPSHPSHASQLAYQQLLQYSPPQSAPSHQPQHQAASAPHSYHQMPASQQYHHQTPPSHAYQQLHSSAQSTPHVYSAADDQSPFPTAAGWASARAAASPPHHAYHAQPTSSSHHPSPIFDKLMDATNISDESESAPLAAAAAHSQQPQSAAAFDAEAHAGTAHDLSQITRAQFNVATTPGQKYLY